MSFVFVNIHHPINKGSPSLVVERETEACSEGVVKGCLGWVV